MHNDYFFKWWCLKKVETPLFRGLKHSTAADTNQFVKVGSVDGDGVSLKPEQRLVPLKEVVDGRQSWTRRGELNRVTPDLAHAGHVLRWGRLYNAYKIYILTDESRFVSSMLQLKI